MSLKRNLVANYASQFYVTLTGILLLPLYLRFMGPEAYGLVGVFALLQAWFNLLDMGLTPTMARETARFRGGATEGLAFRRFARTLEGVFLAVAIVGGGALFASAGFFSRHWLQVTRLPVPEVESAVRLMAVIIALRWMCGLYRSVVTGSERLVWLATYNVTITTLRFVGVVPVLMFVGATPTIFFAFQMGVAVLEFAGLNRKATGLLPAIAPDVPLPWSWAPMKPVLAFSLTIAFTSSVWVFVTQTDKLVLSKLLPLAEYGYYALAVTAAGAVLVVSGPVSAAIMPLMSKLEAQGDHDGVIRVYRNSTQLVAITAGAAAVTAAFCAEPLLWAWTGNPVVARHAASVLALYAIGNGIVAVGAFPYYLQYAKGNLRLHFIGNAIFVGLLVPIIIWAARHYGGEGAGWVWLGMNLLSFLTWTPLVHRRFAPGLNLRWLLRDVLPIIFAAAACGYFAKRLVPAAGSRLPQAAAVLAFGSIVLFAALCASSTARERLAGLAGLGRK